MLQRVWKPVAARVVVGAPATIILPQTIYIRLAKTIDILDWRSAEALLMENAMASNNLAKYFIAGVTVLHPFTALIPGVPVWITIFHHLPDVTKFVLDCDWQGQWNFGLMFHSTDNNPLPFPQLTELEMSCLDDRLESLLTMIELRFHPSGCLTEDKSVASLTRVILRIQDARGDGEKSDEPTSKPNYRRMRLVFGQSQDTL
ncbi:hypothetical protein C8J56DRAFT_1174988 [Mycena floridula]|nr:hypothetical protein C8J56DRAFT_1174988 [Mycena floridula]